MTPQEEGALLLELERLKRRNETLESQVLMLILFQIIAALALLGWLF